LQGCCANCAAKISFDAVTYPIPIGPRSASIPGSAFSMKTEKGHLAALHGLPGLLSAKDFYVAVADLSGSVRQGNKSFLVLFFKKERLAFL
jgi:hypothetical protein